MTKSLTLTLEQIHIPERLRSVDDHHALFIGSSMQTQGQINPVTVRHTPNMNKGKTPYTLVAGAHRLKGAELVGMTEIDCFVVKADEVEAQLIEISENLFRNDMSAMERAVFVQSYRDIWETKYGKIDPKGGRPKNRSNLSQFSNSDKLAQLDQQDNLTNLSQLVNPLDLKAKETDQSFTTHCADRLGLSKSSVKRANQIAQALPKDLREALTGTPIADNQSQLLRLARLAPERLSVAVKALKEHDGDFKAAIAALEDKPVVKQSAEEIVFGKLVDAWGRANADVRSQFLEHAGLKEVE